ncbi:MAG: NAD(P)-binding domain-containing protein [Bradymonadaceae bacterium]|nr:NAD(P)-binding domain-containing protein [Lujinxingiaceae bacterium]
MTTLAIIGAGNVGANLGRRLSMHGYEVTFGVRDLRKAAPLLESIEGPAGLAMVAEAVAASDVVFLAVPGNVALEAVAGLDFEGKILVDCTNPIRWDQGPVWNPPSQGSNAAALAAATNARVVKAFNTFGAEYHADPDTAFGPIDVQIASDHAEALDTVATIAARAGFNPVRAGGLRNAALLENLAVLWIHLAMVSGLGRGIAFKLARRESPPDQPRLGALDVSC